MNNFKPYQREIENEMRVWVWREIFRDILLIYIYYSDLASFKRDNNNLFHSTKRAIGQTGAFSAAEFFFSSFPSRPNPFLSLSFCGAGFFVFLDVF